MNDITGPHERTWASRHPKQFRQIVAWSAVFFAFLASAIALWPEAKSGPQTSVVFERTQSPTKPANVAPSEAHALPDPCGLKDVVCAGESRTISATVTTYQAVREQTDADPCHTADGTDVCDSVHGIPRYDIVANNCLAFGTAIEIRGATYFVHDRMNGRYGCDVFDLLTAGENYTLNNEPVTVL